MIEKDLGTVNLQPQAPDREENIRQVVKSAREALDILNLCLDTLRDSPDLSLTLDELTPDGSRKPIFGNTLKLHVKRTTDY